MINNSALIAIGYGIITALALALTFFISILLFSKARTSGSFIKSLIITMLTLSINTAIVAAIYFTISPIHGITLAICCFTTTLMALFMQGVVKDKEIA